MTTIEPSTRDPERVTRVAPDGDGPVRPTRMLLTKPVVAADGARQVTDIVIAAPDRQSVAPVDSRR
jgi:hypothetical protein